MTPYSWSPMTLLHNIILSFPPLLLWTILWIVINFDKFSIFPMRIRLIVAQEAAQFLHCTLGSFSSHILAFLSSPPLSKNCWQPLTDKFDEKLASWKGNYLSKGTGWSYLTRCLQRFRYISCPSTCHNRWLIVLMRLGGPSSRLVSKKYWVGNAR